jgi:hypothetical protein
LKNLPSTIGLQSSTSSKEEAGIQKEDELISAKFASHSDSKGRQSLDNVNPEDHQARINVVIPMSPCYEKAASPKTD